MSKHEIMALFPNLSEDEAQQWALEVACGAVTVEQNDEAEDE